MRDQETPGRPDEPRAFSVCCTAALIDAASALGAKQGNGRAGRHSGAGSASRVIEH